MYSYISFCYCCLINFCWYNKYFSNVSLEVTFLVETSGGFPGGSDDKASVCNAGDPGSIPGLGRSPGEGNGSPLQYSCLKNPMDRGVWLAIGSQRVGHNLATEQQHIQKKLKV